MPSPRIAFRAVPPLDRHLEQRRHGGDRSREAVAQESLTRYFQLLDHELHDARVSRAQALLLCEVLQGTLVDQTWIGSAAALLADEIAESVEDDDPRAEDLLALAKVVESWTNVRALAVIDAVERFWALPPETPAEQRLIDVGLARKGRTR